MVAKQNSAPVQIRSERFASYDIGDFSAPSPRDHEWKNTPLDRAAPLLGDLDGGRYDYEFDAQPGASANWVPRTDAAVGQTGLKPEDVVSASAWSEFTDALVVTIAADAQIPAPIVLRRTRLGETPRAGHTIVRAEQGAQALVVLDYRGDARFAENLELEVADGADLTVVSVEDWDRTAAHGGAIFCALGADAHLKHVQVSLGGDFIRMNPTAAFRGRGGNLELDGVYFADAGQHIEHQIYVDHGVPDCVSRVTYKGALQGKGAHSVWIGDVLIRANAANTDTYELNRNLVLSDGARSDSVPNLEIATGDIIGAGHASATGRFDDQQLFYLEARGIPETEARKLVVHGFLMDVVRRIGNAELEHRLDEAITTELQHSVM